MRASEVEIPHKRSKQEKQRYSSAQPKKENTPLEHDTGRVRAHRFKRKQKTGHYSANTRTR